jgi:eight-cysteine-cluster-containing protein
MRLWLVVALWFVVACHRGPKEAPIAEGPAPTGPAAEGPSAAELYAGCQSRLEGPEVPGECTTNADCVRAGCSSEVCTTPRAASEMMTTCEVLPCFRAVDACGCVEGRCRWSVAKTTGTAPLLQLPPP